MPNVSERRMNSWRVLVAHLTGPRQELDAVEPLVASEVHLGDERVQVPDRGLADLARARGLDEPS